ncbi:Acyl-CoA thioesterase 2 [Hartmannibacter diazotrophicus]|uniref:Acyl-CoA thioesterase 2 n=1 Tax=Hartmannibacter diazotrophicus TaxID=1482074 RepID=A0A2C9DB63_9HYPH|nr:acyl-CoA thioesterase II [Hartmannibacter diazotrophicus]SON57564.1 Acyl-CoA thioesterase 2 [Hartmannibacter diazotrophicus]
MMQAIEEILRLERIERNLFRGVSPNVGWQRVFGGLVIAQALNAATQTVAKERLAHSLHAYFLLPGDPTIPIIYDVDRIRDGGSFTTRRVVAIQNGRAIFSLAASFHVAEPGLEHQMDMPEGIPDPDSLPGQEEMVAHHLQEAPEPIRRYWERPRPVELRPVDIARYMRRDDGKPSQLLWFRMCDPLPDDDGLHRAALAYVSDMTLLDTALYAHGKAVFDPDLQSASLDHAIWFHRPFRLDDWMLYAQESPASAGGRGFTRGSIYSRDGALVASVAQEGLIRPRRQG